MNRSTKKSWAAALLVSLAAVSGHASTFTDTSGNGQALPSGVSTVGGIVLDLQGVNGSRIVSQLSAGSLYTGYANANPLVVGVQSGFGSTEVSALGGGIASMSVRFTLYDGDTAAGNFDAGSDLTLLVNSVSVGTWGAVMTQTTDASGVASGTTHLGFADGQLDTGWFYTTDATTLANVYSSLASGSVTYSLSDADPYDNYFDFKQGLSASMVNVSAAPTLTAAAPVPEPESMALVLAGLGVVGVTARRRRIGR